jgi:hypothetical protein
MKTRFSVLVKAEIGIGVGWVVVDGGGQVGSYAVCWAVANVHILETEGNTSAVRCCDAVTMLLASQGVVVKVNVNFAL